MTKTMKLLSEALDLPESDRAVLAREILSSLEEDYDADAAKLWREEIIRRSDALHKGKVKTRDAFAAVRRIRATLSPRPSR